MRKTKIVCTIGPASKDVETLKQMINSGMNVARINFSHGGYEDQKPLIQAIKQARQELNVPVALLLDMQGPEVRTGKLEEAPVILETGNDFVLVNEDIVGNNQRVSITYKGLYKDIHVGTRILIDDGAIELETTEIREKDIYCKIIHGAKLGNRKSLNIPGTHLNLPSLKEKDIQDLNAGIMEEFDYVAASFVRNAQDVLDVRKVLNDNGGEKIKIISKIENQEGIDNFSEILKVSDGIMIARGDMGVEIPLEQVPIIQKQFIKECKSTGKFVITATQMLESMITNPRPTRAEVSDVANAIFDETGAIMLSGESAIGNYPIECVQTMNQIAMGVEESIKYWKRFRNREYELGDLNYEFTLNYSVCVAAMNLGAKAIIAYTETGDTPRIISCLLPCCPIFAVTSNEKAYKQLTLAWNVHPILLPEQKTVDELLQLAIRELKEENQLVKNDIIIIAGGKNIVSNIEDSGINRVLGGAFKI